MINKVISGAQTGADRGGIDAAIEMNIPYGGWIPKGRMAENGVVSAEYTLMVEMTRGGWYPKRIEQNVIDSDEAVVFSHEMFIIIWACFYLKMGVKLTYAWSNYPWCEINSEYIYFYLPNSIIACWVNICHEHEI